MEIPVIAPRVACITYQISVRTPEAPAFIDITDEVLARVSASGIETGLAVLTSQHTTAALLINEHEPELLKDLSRLLSEIAPRDRDYAHNGVPCEPNESANGHAHCQALLLQASATIPVVQSSPVLGRYQRIFLVELDCPRPRRVAVSILGS